MCVVFVFAKAWHACMVQVRRVTVHRVGLHGVMRADSQRFVLCNVWLIHAGLHKVSCAVYCFGLMYAALCMLLP